MTAAVRRRVLVTCSRSFTQWVIADDALAAQETPGNPKPVLVHGACPHGDQDIAGIAWMRGWRVETHPANWDAGRQAGLARNAEMVESGADVLLAFIGACEQPRCRRTGPHDSHGATHTITLARRAGIPVRVFRESGEGDWDDA